MGREANPRLKVYKTRIGVDEWLVAAPNQKAALNAWDVRENLFAHGAATLVTDEAERAVALNAPGKAVRSPHRPKLAGLPRGATGGTARRKKKHAPAPVKEPALPKAKPPDRTRLNHVEMQLDAYRKRAAKARAALEKRRHAMAQDELRLKAALQKEERKLEKQRDREQRKFQLRLV